MRSDLMFCQPEQACRFGFPFQARQLVYSRARYVLRPNRGTAVISALRLTALSSGGRIPVQEHTAETTMYVPSTLAMGGNLVFCQPE